MSVYSGHKSCEKWVSSTATLIFDAPFRTVYVYLLKILFKAAATIMPSKKSNMLSESAF